MRQTWREWYTSHWRS